MGRRLYVGNLPYQTTDEELGQLFAQAGAVESVRVMRDLATGRARGFAFVQMASDEAAQKAISDFHQFQFGGRPLVVNEARPKPPMGSGFEADYGRAREAGGDFGSSRREPRW
jgi:cold-inducible RNA-binding protein